jgi:hypothetical protein
VVVVVVGAGAEVTGAGGPSIPKGNSGVVIESGDNVGDNKKRTMTASVNY